MKQEIKTLKAPTPTGPYSQGLKVGNRIYVAGQGPLNPETGKVPENIEEQTEQVLKNIEIILKEAGASINNIVKVQAYLANLKDVAMYNSVYDKFFSQPYPVRTTVGSQLDNILVEVDVIAELEQSDQVEFN